MGIGRSGHWAKWGLGEMKELGEMASGRNEKWAKAKWEWAKWHWAKWE
jgi:hypothetical protein